MRAHVIENSVVTNTIEVESLDFLPNLVEATEGSIGWFYENGVFTPPAPQPVPVPSSVSPRQFRQALDIIAMYDSVQTAVAAADNQTKIWWEYATSVDRDNAPLNAMAGSLGVTHEQLDDIFRLAATL